MEKRFIDDGVLKGYTPLTNVNHSESTIYKKGSDIVKILHDKYRTKEREQTTERLGAFVCDECSLPHTILYDKHSNKPFAGFIQPNYSEYELLIKCLEDNTIPFKKRITIAKKISALIESFEKERFSYYDIHAENVLVDKEDIKLIDMDSVLYKDLSDPITFRVHMGLTSKYLSYLVLSIIFSKDFFPFDEEVEKNKRNFDKFANERQRKVIEAAATTDYKVFYPYYYIDSFTEDYVEETSSILRLEK